MESGDQPVDLILNQMQQTTPAKELMECLLTLSKLIQNIISQPFESKYRIIKPKNSVMRSKLFSLPNIERLLIVLGYQYDGENFVMSDEMLGGLLDATPYLDIRKRLLQASQGSNVEYQRELVVAKNQRLVLKKKKKEGEEAERLLTLARNDQRERKYMKPDTNTKNVGYSSGGAAKSWGSIGVELCKPGK